MSFGLSGARTRALQHAVQEMLAGRIGLSVAAVLAAGAFLVSASAAHADSSFYVATLLLASGENGAPYSQTVTAVGGTIPYSWAITAGTLPTGLSLDSSSGVISGVPSTVGSTDFTVRVVDAAAHTALQALTITSSPPLTLSNAPVIAGQLGMSYAATLDATGGVAPLSWALTTGALPTGLALNGATGQVSGTPTTVGNSAFTVQVTDRLNVVATQALSIAVNPAAQAVSITTSGSMPTDLALIVFAGGTLPALVTSTGCNPATMALWATSGGEFVVYVPGASVAAVNARFLGLFPNGTIAPNTVFMRKCL